MSTQEFTKEELVKIEQAINLYQTGSVDGGEDVEDYRVVRTQETTDDFKATGNWSDINRNSEKGDNWTADLIKGYQFAKGEPRVNLFVIDLGHVRAVVEF